MLRIKRVPPPIARSKLNDEPNPIFTPCQFNAIDRCWHASTRDRFNLQFPPDRTTADPFINPTGDNPFSAANPQPHFCVEISQASGNETVIPPRIWQDSQAELNAWSLTPNLATTYEYFNCGIVPVGASAGSCMATATLIPIVQPHANAGYTVKLQVNFGSAQSPSTHTWEFWVKDPKTIEFVADTGVPLLTPRQ